MISLETVLEIGFEKEKIRQTFYSRLADKTDREAFKVLFTKLSDWEKGHLKVFEQLKASLPCAGIRQTNHPEIDRGRTAAYRLPD